MPGASDLPGRHDDPEAAGQARWAGHPDLPEHPDSRKHPDSRRHPDSREQTAGSQTQLRQRLGRLPDGHPSSPYREDGNIRLPAADLRKFEFATEPGADESSPADRVVDRASGPRRDSRPEQTEDRGERPEDQAQHAKDRPERVGDNGSESWRAALPQLHALWERHQERWPEAQRSPIDRSTDEEGSWRGDAGHYLNMEENLVTEHALDRLREGEPEVSRTMKAVEAEVPGARLVGQQNCLKGEDRFKEKVAEDCRAMPDRSVGEIAEHVPDAVRYTCQLGMDGYVDGYLDLCDRVKQEGHEMILSRNSWTSTQYKGINTRWKTATDQLFEIQFHTSESYEAKQFTHRAYERIRSPDTASAERKELYTFQVQVSARIPVPNGALSIADYHKDES